MEVRAGWLFYDMDDVAHSSVICNGEIRTAHIELHNGTNIECDNLPFQVATCGKRHPEYADTHCGLPPGHETGDVPHVGVHPTVPFIHAGIYPLVRLFTRRSSLAEELRGTEPVRSTAQDADSVLAAYDEERST